MKKTVVYAVILSVASIVLGLVAGVAIERGNTIKQLTLGRPELPFEKQREERKARKPQDIFKRVSEELNLNPEQKERVKQILDEARKKISLTGEKSREDLKVSAMKAILRLWRYSLPSNRRNLRILSPKLKKTI